LRDLGIHKKITLRPILRKIWRSELDSCNSGYGPEVGSCKYSNNLSVL
jgi:hypothetical protein